MEAVAYKAPALSPQERRLLDALAGRDAGFGVDVGGVSWRVEPRPLSARAEGAPVLAAQVGESVWRVSMAATEELFDALGIPDDVDRSALPEAVLWGVAEARLDGLLKGLEALAGQGARIVAPDEGAGAAACCLEFTMSAEGGRELRGWVHVPLDEESVHAVERAMGRRPHLPPQTPPAPVELGVEAGRMVLTMAELRALKTGDVLLPEAWHPAAGCLYLSAPPLRARVPWPQGGDGQPDIDIQGGEDMSEEKKEAPEATEAQKTDAAPVGGLGAVEIDVVFEVGRLRMSIEELEHLGEGKTLPLPEALGPQVPVSVMGNGRKLATGRIVSLGETIGVQITGLEGRSS